MVFLNSFLFCSEGSYDLGGIKIDFQNELPFKKRQKIDSIFSLALKHISKHPFCVITQGYAHIFVHEISHALVYKLLTGQNAKVLVIKNSFQSFVTYPVVVNKRGQAFIIDISGPIGSVAFSSCKLVAAAALKNYLSWPVALVLGGGAAMCITGELLHAGICAFKKSQTDFGFIAKRGCTSLVLASLILVSEAALAVFASFKLAS